MPLKFPGRWRFQPPADGVFVNQVIPEEAVADFVGLIMRFATQGERKEVLEHFKGHLFIVDQCDDLPDDPPPDRDGPLETRRLADGRAFTIVKVYYHPLLLACRVRQLGFETEAERIGPFFLHQWDEICFVISPGCRR